MNLWLDMGTSRENTECKATTKVARHKVSSARILSRV